jgi:hypothetical protein
MVTDRALMPLTVTVPLTARVSGATLIRAIPEALELVMGNIWDGDIAAAKTPPDTVTMTAAEVVE